MHVVHADIRLSCATDLQSFIRKDNILFSISLFLLGPKVLNPTTNRYRSTEKDYALAQGHATRN